MYLNGTMVQLHQLLEVLGVHHHHLLQTPLLLLQEVQRLLLEGVLLEGEQPHLLLLEGVLLHLLLLEEEQGLLLLLEGVLLLLLLLGEVQDLPLLLEGVQKGSSLQEVLQKLLLASLQAVGQRGQST